MKSKKKKYRVEKTNNWNGRSKMNNENLLEVAILLLLFHKDNLDVSYLLLKWRIFQGFPGTHTQPFPLQ